MTSCSRKIFWYWGCFWPTPLIGVDKKAEKFILLFLDEFVVYLNIEIFLTNSTKKSITFAKLRFKYIEVWFIKNAFYFGKSFVHRRKATDFVKKNRLLFINILKLWIDKLSKNNLKKSIIFERPYSLSLYNGLIHLRLYNPTFCVTSTTSIISDNEIWRRVRRKGRMYLFCCVYNAARRQKDIALQTHLFPVRMEICHMISNRNYKKFLEEKLQLLD